MIRSISLLILAVGLIVNPYQQPILSVAGVSILVYAAANSMIPVAAPALIKIGLSGKDRLKPHQTAVIAESAGVVVGVIYIFAVILLTPFVHSNNGLAAYLSGILSIQSMIMLGFADDLFDLRWRHKFFLPAIAAIPMLIVYAAEHGNTHIALPPVCSRVLNLPVSIDLGVLYYFYMAAVAIFATNCINIYAGVNGLETGQTLVVALSVLVNDCIYLWRYYFQHSIAAVAVRPHILSVYFVLPLVACCLALLKYNWFPAKVFVGDTFCYFAGMVLAVVGILGHFSKTMLSLILPQIINFLYSMPQLLRIVPCPRHRMPLIDPQTGKLLPSRADVTNLAGWKIGILRILSLLGLLQIWESHDKATKQKKIEVSNMTLINLTLVHLGPVKEDQLTKALLAIQVVSSASALFVRHMLAKMLFGRDNL